MSRTPQPTGLRALCLAVSRLLALQTQAQSSPVVLAIRGDRAAAKACGFASPTAFSIWAVARGLKPAFKAVQQKRTIYLISELLRACAQDAADQFAQQDGQKERRASA